MRRWSARKWLINFIIALGLPLALVVLLTYVMDPYFHYHAPYSWVSYRLYEERFTNDGIAKNFTYDAVITGTSMTQNFKVSQLEELFGVQAVKMPFSGAGFQEITDNLKVALESQDVKMVVMALDYSGLRRDYDWAATYNYPTYLYDDNPWNDLAYFFNKDIFYHGTLNALYMTLSGQESTTFDEYSSWEAPTGIAVLSQLYHREDYTSLRDQESLTEEERERVTKNIQDNICSVVEKYPEVTFYFYYSPYSIYYWDSICLTGEFTAQLEADEITAQLLLPYENVKLFGFTQDTQINTDPNNYRDIIHYKSSINEQMLRWMKEDTYLLTTENYNDYLSSIRDYYSTYDYDQLYTSWEESDGTTE